MLTAVRDVMAAKLLGDRLGELREEYIRRAIRGEIPDEDFMGSGEMDAISEIKRRFFSINSRRLVRPQDAESVTDDNDFLQPVQQMTFSAIRWTHRRMAAIPFVGHPDHEAR